MGQALNVGQRGQQVMEDGAPAGVKDYNAATKTENEIRKQITLSNKSTENDFIKSNNEMHNINTDLSADGQMIKENTVSGIKKQITSDVRPGNVSNPISTTPDNLNLGDNMPGIHAQVMDSFQHGSNTLGADAIDPTKKSKIDFTGTQSNTSINMDKELAKNFWTGEGFSADHWLAQASADDPTAIGAGTIFGGKQGGGVKGLVGAVLRATGTGIVGGDPSFYSESSLFADSRGGKGENTETVNQTEVKKYVDVDTDYSQQEVTPDAERGEYPVQQTEESRQSFRDTFASERELRNRTFLWEAEDGIEREYSTQLKDESAEDWTAFLNNTANAETAVDNVMDLSSNQAFQTGDWAKNAFSNEELNQY
jgi:hypothetical protein